MLIFVEICVFVSVLFMYMCVSFLAWVVLFGL